MGRLAAKEHSERILNPPHGGASGGEDFGGKGDHKKDSGIGHSVSKECAKLTS
jgi:hypothetical protein